VDLDARLADLGRAESDTILSRKPLPRDSSDSPEARMPSP
jgi:hypothetical protein